MELTKTILLLSAIIGTIYCTTYGDGSVKAEFEVLCDDTHLAVYFNKTALDERTVANYNNRSYSIKFDGQSSPACMVAAGDTSTVDADLGSLISSAFNPKIYIGIAYATEMCGIGIHADDDYIFYNGTVVVTYGENPNTNIVREEYDNYHVTCLRNRTVEEKLNGDSYNVESRVTGEESKNTTAVFNVTLTHTDMSDVVKSTYLLGDLIKFTMSLNSASSVKGVIQKCWATSDGSANEYNLISDRCTLEQKTYWEGFSIAKQTVFKTEAFRYLSSGNTIFVECLIRVCLDTDSTADCSLCAPAPSVGRKRRDVAQQIEGNSKEQASQTMTARSPVFYILEREPAQSSPQEPSQQSVLSGTNGLIIVVLFSAFIFVICAAVIKKVFFTPAQVMTDAPVVAYHNKAMA